MTALLEKREWAGLCWPDLLDGLTAIGRTDIPLARLAEGHIDALRILRQAGRDPVPGSLYGVWASRSRGGGLSTIRQMDRFRLSGTVPFASGVGLLDRALITASVQPRPEAGVDAAQQEQLLMDVDVHDWTPNLDSWQTAAMAASRSFTVAVRDRSVPAYGQVGPPGFYLGRAGFFPGGIGVAAVWVGAAARVADLVTHFVCGSPNGPDQATRINLGKLRLELSTAHALVRHAGAILTAGADSPTSGWSASDLQELATEVRAGVGAAVRRLLDVGRSLAGPAGLAHEADLSGAIADLDLYVRQQHSDRDAEFLAGHDG
ncbi:MAG: hypothetical protein M3Z00_01240 [Actinomycetota bacterium]|nr:hypothetical protein [Actinomycetota bacterium]